MLRSGKVRKAEVMCRSGAARAQSWLAAQRRGAATHRPERLTSSEAHLASGQEVFPFLLRLPYRKGQEQWKGSAYQILTCLVACLSLALEYSWGLPVSLMKSTFIMFLEEESFQISALSLGVIGTKMNK